MTSDEILELLANVEFFVLVASVNLFVVSYQILAKWWKDEFGRHLFAVALAESLVLDHSVIVVVFGDHPGRRLITAVLYGILAGVMVWRVSLLIRVQVTSRLQIRDARASAQISRDTDSSLDITPRPDNSVVERVDSMGGDHERLG